MLLILRHTISSLVPRQSRPLQNVNTTSVTTIHIGHLCSGAMRVRHRHFQRDILLQERTHHVIVLLHTVSAPEVFGSSVFGFGFFFRPTRRNASEGHFFNNIACAVSDRLCLEPDRRAPRVTSPTRSVSSLQPRRRAATTQGRCIQCSPRACAWVRPEGTDNLEEPPETTLAHAYTHGPRGERVRGGGNGFRAPERGALLSSPPVRRLGCGCPRPASFLPESSISLFFGGWWDTRQGGRGVVLRQRQALLAL